MQLNTAKRASFDEGSLDQYLREISQYPLITREEEVTLAQRIKQSDAEALDKLVRSNLRFVVSVAKKYQNQGVSLSDLINEGNLGLIRAAHKFDETKGIKFISYAVWWIRQAILQALAEQSRIVRVPLNRAGTLHRIGKRSASLLQELGREPTVEEIAEGMDISQEEVAKTLSISQAHLSLDAPLTPGEDNKLLDYLPDTQNPGPDDEIFEHALTESIEEVLATLKDREAKRSEEHTSELQSQFHLVCRLLLEKKNKTRASSSINHPARRHSTSGSKSRQPAADAICCASSSACCAASNSSVFFATPQIDSAVAI